MKNKNNFIKNLLIYITFFICFTIFVIFSISIYSKNKTFRVNKAFDSLDSIENCSIDFKLSKKAITEDGTEIINIVYKTLINKNYNNENLLAFDGTLGVEVESMKIGIYLPIQIICDDNIRFATEIDEVYQTIIEIPDNNTKLHADLKPILSVFDNDYENLDINLLSSDLFNIFKNYFANNKKNFNYIKNDEQFYVFTGAIGRFNKNINDEDFDELISITKEVCKEDSLNYKIISSLIEKVRGTYTLYLDVNNSQLSKITLRNDNIEVSLNLKNINYNNEINFPENYENYGLDFNKYLDENNFNLLSLIGLNEDGTANLKTTLQKHFKELMSYMYLCMEHSEAGDSTSAQNYIELMSSLISNIEETPNISDKDKKTFDTFIEVYKLLMRYTIIYNQQCFSSDEQKILDLEEQMFATVEELSKKLNSLGIDIKETFGEIVQSENNVPINGSEVGNEEEIDSSESTEVEKEIITIENSNTEENTNRENIPIITPENSK